MTTGNVTVRSLVMAGCFAAVGFDFMAGASAQAQDPKPDTDPIARYHVYRAFLIRLHERAARQRKEFQEAESLITESLIKEAQKRFVVVMQEASKEYQRIHAIENLRPREKVIQEYLDKLTARPRAERPDSFIARFHARELDETKRELEQIRREIRSLEAGRPASIPGPPPKQP